MADGNVEKSGVEHHHFCIGFYQYEIQFYSPESIRVIGLLCLSTTRTRIGSPAELKSDGGVDDLLGLDTRS